MISAGLIFGVHLPSRFYFCFFFFVLGFDPFNTDFYCAKFDFPFDSSCKYLDFKLVSEDK